MKLELNRRYIMRNGNVTTLVLKDSHLGLWQDFQSDKGIWYYEVDEGKSNISSLLPMYDLVEELTDTE